MAEQAVKADKLVDEAKAAGGGRSSGHRPREDAAARALQGEGRPRERARDGNSKDACLAPPAEDIALIFLDESVAGVTPAPIAEEGYLDTLDLKNETFTVVGYGTDEFITGSGASPKAITVFDGIRSYRDVTAISGQDAFPDRFLKITAGVCFGDSGGPLVHGETIVALNTWTFSYRCDGPNLEYRVDSAVAQEFLATYQRRDRCPG